MESTNPVQENCDGPETTTDQFSSNTSTNLARVSNVGTFVFGAFAVVSLLVSIAKGITPLYILESGGWAWAAWYWHKKKVKSDTAKALVFMLGVAVAIGEVIHYEIRVNSEHRVASVATFDPIAAGAIPVSTNSTDSSRSVQDGSPAASSTIGCPDALPSEISSKMVSGREVSKLVGSDGNLVSEDDTSYSGEFNLWNANLTYANFTENQCITTAMVELELSYEGKVSKERYSIAFEPILGPGKTQIAHLRLRMRTPERGEDAALVGWHTISFSGFPAHQ